MNHALQYFGTSGGHGPCGRSEEPGWGGIVGQEHSHIPMSDSPDSSRIQAILASGIKIPPLPEILVRIQALLADPDVDIADVAGLIRRDGALCGAVFRVVGSPVFGLHAKVETVERAVTLLGIPPTLAILRGIALRDAFGDETAQAALEALWRRSARIAQLAMAATRILKPQGFGPDQAYTLGMFHDCGLALLAKRFPAYAQALAQDAWPDIPSLDHAHATDHTLLGETVARNWQLPGVIAKAIRHHHEPQPSPAVPDEALRLGALLNLACHLHRLAGGEDDGEWEAEDGWRAACLARLGLSLAALADLEEQTRAAAGGLAA